MIKEDEELERWRKKEWGENARQTTGNTVSKDAAGVALLFRGGGVRARGPKYVERSKSDSNQPSIKEQGTVH